ncbi:hypothetical protein D3C87_1973890 [compost metagenome]
MGNVAEDHSEAGCRLALALAGVDDNKTLLVGLRRHDLFAGGLLLRHLHRVTRVVLLGDALTRAHHIFAHDVLLIL